MVQWPAHLVQRGEANPSFKDYSKPRGRLTCPSLASGFQTTYDHRGRDPNRDISPFFMQRSHSVALDGLDVAV